jgi:O-antigen ligase
MFNAPPLIRFVARWSLTGAAIGVGFAAALVLTDAGGIGGLLWRSSSAGIAFFIMAVSFAVTFSQITLLLAVALRSDFGGDGSSNDRLTRWKSGQSAELDDDSPLP